MKKLSDYAKQHGCCYKTAYNHYRQGLIEGAYQLPTGRVVIPDSSDLDKNITGVTPKKEYIVTYARVSSSENKTNIMKQSERLKDFCSAKGWTIQESVEEVGSGINDNRKKLLKIFKEEKATKIIVEHKDRLTRFGFNYIQELCNKFDCEIIILNETESRQENLIEDFVSIITSFCAKIYGQRRSKRKTEKLIKELENGK
jgi:putative resolvase